MKSKIKDLIFFVLRYSGLCWYFREVLQKNKVTIIVYHDIDKNRFEQQINWLNNHYTIIPLATFLNSIKSGDSKPLPAKALIITFDDGHKANYTLLPILQKLNKQITIFLCSNIINTNRHYWFKHDLKGEDVQDFKKLSDAERLEKLRNLGYEDEKEFENREALTLAEINDMQSFVDFQAHTATHPILPTCDDEKSFREIALSKSDLETVLNKPVTSLAFPNGDFTEREIKYCKRAGYEFAFTTVPGYNTIKENPYQLKRIVLQDDSCLSEVIVKTSGLWSFLKK